MDVKSGRRIQLGRIKKIDLINFIVLSVVTNESDILPLSVDGKITGKTQSVKDGETVPVNLVSSRTADLTYHGETQVHELHGNDGFLCLLAGNDEVLDVCRSLFPCLAGQVDSTYYREVNVTIGVKGVTGNIVGRDGIAGPCIGSN